MDEEMVATLGLGQWKKNYHKVEWNILVVRLQLIIFVGFVI